MATQIIAKLTTLSCRRLPHFQNIYRSTIFSRQFSNSSRLNSDLLFSTQHEWVKVTGDSGTVGITQYAADKLGDIVYVQLPEIGNEISQNDECGAIESVKAASEIYSPLSGTISKVNSDLESNSALINKSPHDQGWIFQIKLSKSDELKDLMSEEDYNKFIESQD